MDLDADHMVCDLVPWERMVQRIGRVNRRGGGNARVRVIPSDPSGRKPESDSAEAVRRLLQGHLPRLADGDIDVSPEALRALKAREAEDQGLRNAVQAATTPVPLRPALTRALVDTWSLTSLRAVNPGRPNVTPWLRGWVEEHVQTVVAWRTHLPVRPKGPSLKSEIEAFFEAAPVHTSEHLETETFRVVDWLMKRAGATVAQHTDPDEVLAFILNSAGESLRQLAARLIIRESELPIFESSSLVGACRVSVSPRHPHG